MVTRKVPSIDVDELTLHVCARVPQGITVLYLDTYYVYTLYSTH